MVWVVSKKCPKCKSTMESGFRTNTGFGAPRWQETWAKKSNESKVRWGLQTFQGDLVKNVITYRCKKCGFLESYCK